MKLLQITTNKPRFYCYPESCGDLDAFIAYLESRCSLFVPMQELTDTGRKTVYLNVSSIVHLEETEIPDAHEP